MKERYRLFLRRKSVYYAFDNTTKTFESLKTKDKVEATRLLMALNEAGTHSFVIAVHLQHIFRPMRIMLHCRDRLHQAPASLVNIQIGPNFCITIT